MKAPSEGKTAWKCRKITINPYRLRYAIRELAARSQKGNTSQKDAA